MYILEACFPNKDVTKHKTLRDNIKPVVLYLLLSWSNIAFCTQNCLTVSLLNFT